MTARSGSGGHVIPPRLAVMAVDPGGTSGWAKALLNPGAFAYGNVSVRGVLRRAARRGTFEAGEVGGSSWDQCWWLADAWAGFRFRAHVELGIPAPDCVLVIERFVLRQRAVELSPVEVTHGLVTLLRGQAGSWIHGRPVFQGTGVLGFGTSARLRDWGVWTVGSEHARDATRHLAAYLNSRL